jgi:hypothetical protein
VEKSGVEMRNLRIVRNHLAGVGGRGPNLGPLWAQIKKRSCLEKRVLACFVGNKMRKNAQVARWGLEVKRDMFLGSVTERFFVPV